MPTKSVKLNVLTSGVDRAISDMTKLSASKSDLSKGATIRLNLQDADLTTEKLDALKLQVKELSDKGADIRIKLEGAGTAESELAALGADAEGLSMSGAKVSGSLKDAGTEAEGFGSKLKNAVGSVGIGAVAALAVGLGLSAKVALDAQSSIALLGNAIHDAGGNIKTYQASINSTEDSMAKFGYTGSQVDTALTTLIHATGSVSVSENAMGTAANLAAARHISLTSAVSMLAKASGGAMRGMKDLGITQVTGATQAKAMASAQTTLTDQINSAGGIAEFAAAHNMSLAKATQLVAEAQGESSHAADILAGKGTTLAAVTTKVTEAENGDATAKKELAKMGLTVSQAQDLVTQSASGNIKAMNELGIVVLPKTATAAQRLAEIQQVLNEKLGGAAAAQAATFQGKLAALRAEFTNIAERIGLAVLPALTDLLGGFVKLAGCKPILDALVIVIGLIAVAFIAMKVQAIIAMFATRDAMISSGVGILILALGVAIMELMNHWRGLETGIKDVWHGIEDASKAAFDWLKNNWETLLAIMLSLCTMGMSLVALEVYKHWHDIESYTDSLRTTTASIWTGMMHDIASIWDTIWNNTIGRLERGISDAQGLMNQFTSWITQRFSSAGSWLVNAGRDLINGLFNGATAIISTVGSWVSNIGNKIITAVKKFFGIHSPSSVFMDIGKNMMLGLLHGIIANNPATMVTKLLGGMPGMLKDLLLGGFLKNITSMGSNAVKLIEGWGSSALGALGSAGGAIGGFFSKIFGGGSGGGGVLQWKNLTDIALMLNNLPDSLDARVLYQMQTESGGNPNAINNWDSNAAAGDPSRGLMQTIMSTFMAYHIPGTSMNIYDPLANIAAAINYAKHVYGPSLMNGRGGMGSGHGYFAGGVIPEMVLGVGMRSGERYSFGERGPELVTPMGGRGGGSSSGGGDTININIGVATDPNATAQAIHQMLRRYKTKKGNQPLGLG